MGHPASKPSIPRLDAVLHAPGAGGAAGGPGPGQWKPAVPAPLLLVHGRARRLLPDFRTSQPDCPPQLLPQRQRQAEERRQPGGGCEYGSPRMPVGGGTAWRGAAARLGARLLCFQRDHCPPLRGKGVTATTATRLPWPHLGAYTVPANTTRSYFSSVGFTSLGCVVLSCDVCVVVTDEAWQVVWLSPGCQWCTSCPGASLPSPHKPHSAFLPWALCSAGPDIRRLRTVRKGPKIRVSNKTRNR